MLLMVSPWKLEPFLTLSCQPPLYRSICLKACVFHNSNKVCKLHWSLSQLSLQAVTSLNISAVQISFEEIQDDSCCCALCDVWPTTSFYSLWFEVETFGGYPPSRPKLWSPWKNRHSFGSWHLCWSSMSGLADWHSVRFHVRFGCVFAGKLNVYASSHSITSHNVSVVTGDDLLRKLWEIEEWTKDQSYLTPEERSVVQHFKDNHSRTEDGRFIVSQPHAS